MEHIEVQWAWGRKEAEVVLDLAKRAGERWIRVVRAPADESFEDNWMTWAYPLRYYLNLEDNVETKVEFEGENKVLYAKYTPPATRRGRLKKFFRRSSKSN